MAPRSDLARIVESSRLPGSTRLAHAVRTNSGVEAAADTFRAPFLPGAPPTLPSASSFAEGTLNAIGLLDTPDEDEDALDRLEDRARWVLVVLWAQRHAWHNPGLGWERVLMSEWDTPNRPVRDGWGVALQELASYPNCPHREWLNDAADRIPGADQERFQRITRVHKTRTVTSRTDYETPVVVPHGQYAFDLVSQQMMTRTSGPNWVPTDISRFDTIAASQDDFADSVMPAASYAGLQLIASCAFLIGTDNFRWNTAIAAVVVATVVGMISREMLLRYWTATSDTLRT